MARVVVTGAAGAVGRPVVRELVRRGHRVLGVDQLPSTGCSESVELNIAGRTSVREALQGAEVVVHLAAQPHDRDFAHLVPPNVTGLYNVLEGAREQGVERVIIASSVQVVGAERERRQPVSVDATAPMNHYALTKLWAEQMGAMYSQRFGISVLMVRIAWMVRDQREAAMMLKHQLYDMYLSAHDAGRFFALAVEAEPTPYAVVYAASMGGEKIYDMEPSRRLLGYQAQDRWPAGLDFEWP